MMAADLFAAAPQPVDHRCLGCGKVHPGAREVRLIDGRLVSSFSEEWRHECEARSILDIPGVHARQAHLSKIADKRGQKIADRLKATMMVIWNQRQAAAGSYPR